MTVLFISFLSCESQRIIILHKIDDIIQYKNIRNSVFLNEVGYRHIEVAEVYHIGLFKMICHKRREAVRKGILDNQQLSAVVRLRANLNKRVVAP